MMQLIRALQMTTFYHCRAIRQSCGVSHSLRCLLSSRHRCQIESRVALISHAFVQINSRPILVIISKHVPFPSVIATFNCLFITILSHESLRRLTLRLVQVWLHVRTLTVVDINMALIDSQVMALILVLVLIGNEHNFFLAHFKRLKSLQLATFIAHWDS